MQLVLPVAFNKQNAFETFVSGDNIQLVQHIKSLLDESSNFDTAPQHMSFIVGPQASGKTHLLLAACDAASKAGLSHQYIDLAKILAMPVEVLHGLSQQDVLCVDNLQLVEENLPWQQAIFDLINQFTERSGKALLIASTQSLAELSLQLPDLRTRLSWGTNFLLSRLNDDEKLTALSKHAKALGLSFQMDTLKFILSRVGRDMHELMSVLQRLDEKSLQNKRKITIPFVKKQLSL